MSDKFLRIVDAFWRKVDEITSSATFKYGALGFIFGGFFGKTFQFVLNIIELNADIPDWLNYMIFAFGALFMVGLGWCLYNAPVFITVITLSAVGYFLFLLEFGMPGLQAYLTFVLLCTLVYIAVLLSIQVSKIREVEKEEKERYINALRRLALFVEADVPAAKKDIFEKEKKACEDEIEKYRIRVRDKFNSSERAEIREYDDRIDEATLKELEKAREKNEAEHLK